ncbi:endochitinase A-like isoform X1 [Solanum pennellii]|uniref:Endochitinase A-like isoform X1 n=2 Tax=Solanum pennellii TaxID=28526 RepID=A0ABM1GUH0_SOLPN|nr:endochitinase A-like isoform X1 [Solanum pennellii]XP_015076194.1 endochitinase A-like isoform X1 [Solanum pennellii]XP_015076196.1 endochitinase A-like isoform X1 [Solanum pennellii]
MGESIVDTPAVKHKMGDSVVSRPTLEVSVSFGRFENDALSWEKWSSFSPNKYLEEVEKCSTPGSVAQKKAYFEAHYKRIAAKKLEQLEEETRQVEQGMEPLSPEVTEPKSGDVTENGNSDGDFSSSNGERSSVDEQQMSVVNLKNSDAVDEPKEDITVDVECDNLLVTEAKELTISGIDESKDDTSVDIECVSPLVTEAKEGTISGIDESNEDISVDVECDSLVVTKTKEESILGTCDKGELNKAEERNPEKVCQDSVVETPQANTEAQKASLRKSRTPNANVKNVPRKVYTPEARVSAGTKKKLTSPVAKSSRFFSPTSKQAPTSKVITPSLPSVKKVTGMSTQRSNNTPLAQPKKLVPGSFVSPSQSSNKKLNGATPSQSSNKKLNGASPSQSSNKNLNGATPSQSSNKKLNGATSSRSSSKTLNGAALQRSVNSPMLEDKRRVPTSLHMSLSLSSPNSTASTNTMRRSLFMETMGDKDIVKRAFKAFQNSYSQGRSVGDMTYDVQDQVSSKESEQKISTSSTQKESERLRKTPDKVITLKGQSGTRSTSSSSGAPKDAGVEKKRVNSIRASTSSRIDRSTDKWKEEVTKGKIKRPGSNR